MSPPARNPRRIEGESGQISVLVLGMVLIVLMLTAVIFGATRVNLEARKLFSTADGAATAAAASIEPGYSIQAPAASQLQAAVEEHLLVTDAHQNHYRLHVVRTWASDDGETVHVELAAAAELPVLRWIMPAEVPVVADSHARVTINR